MSASIQADDDDDVFTNPETAEKLICLLGTEKNPQKSTDELCFSLDPKLPLLMQQRLTPASQNSVVVSHILTKKSLLCCMMQATTGTTTSKWEHGGGGS